MDILIISPGYLIQPAINGGAIETLIDTIINENEKFKKAKFTIFSIYDGTEIKPIDSKLVEYKYIDIRRFSYKIKRIICALINKLPNVYIGKAYIRDVVKKINSDNIKYDAIVIENNPIFAYYVRKHTSKPIIVHLHNDYLNNKTKFSKKILNSTTKILTVSNYIGNRVKTIEPNTNKVSTLYNGIDLTIFSNELSINEKENLRKKYNLNSNDIVILYTGRIMKEKGVKELIYSFIEIKKKYNNLKLLLVGSSFFKNSKASPYQKELAELSKKYRNDIIFTGYIEHDMIWKIYKMCDIQIVPSIWGEPLATTVIEGMAAKIPLIVNNVGGIPEMVCEDSAFICKNDTLVKDICKYIELLIENPNILTKKVNNSYNYVQRFDKSVYYNNYIDILSKIIGEND